MGLDISILITVDTASYGITLSGGGCEAGDRTYLAEGAR